jgi:uncharacterized protein (DUF924 family)
VRLRSPPIKHVASWHRTDLARCSSWFRYRSLNGHKSYIEFDSQILEGSAIVDDPKGGWVGDVLKFWFEQTEPAQWFEKDPMFDASIRERFLGWHEILVSRGNKGLLADAQTALAAVIVLDQMSRNMFRDTPRAFATDPQALRVAEAAIARGFDARLTKDQRMFLYLPFEHSEDRQSQARSVALMASLGDPELQKWAEAHRAIVDRFGRFPHRNGVLGRISTPEETEFLKQPDSYF